MLDRHQWCWCIHFSEGHENIHDVFRLHFYVPMFPFFLIIIVLCLHLNPWKRIRTCEQSKAKKEIHNKENTNTANNNIQINWYFYVSSSPLKKSKRFFSSASHMKHNKYVEHHHHRIIEVGKQRLLLHSHNNSVDQMLYRNNLTFRSLSHTRRISSVLSKQMPIQSGSTVAHLTW